MNTERWDAIAEAFAAGEWVPANGWAAWNEQAITESVTIRSALPHSVDCLLEVGCGVGRLTPYLGLLFPHVVAIDTSAACRTVTRRRCRDRSNIDVYPPDAQFRACDAALVWGNLYDSDWPPGSITGHREQLRAKYPIVLEGNAGSWALTQTWPDGRRMTRLDKGSINVFEP